MIKKKECEYLNKECWLVKNLKYSPYKRCEYCRLKFRKCLFLQYQIISLILISLVLISAFFIEGKVSELLIISVFVLVITYGYFFNKSTDRIIQAKFNEEKANDSLGELTQKLEEKVASQTKEIRKSYEVEKKAHEELKKLDRAKDQFVLTTQHHLRTPVTGMLGYLDLMFTGSFGKIPKKLGGALDRFQSATKILSRLIDEFLDISQFQIGRKVVALKPEVELNLIIDQVIEEVSMEAEKKKLSLKFKKNESLPKITADPEKLKTALFNIINNAIKYTTTGGVVIKTSKKDGSILIEVKDTGRGIPQEELIMLFKKLFERGDKADKFYAIGRGIGLFVSTLIIEAHNGKIWAESQGQDKGSSFFIQLPIK